MSKNNSNKNKNNKNNKAAPSAAEASEAAPVVAEGPKEVPAAAAATEVDKPKRVVERRPVLVLYMAKIKEAKTEVVRIATSLEAWSRQEKSTPEQKTKLSDLLSLTKELTPRFDEFEINFSALAETGFVPSTIQVRAPKFSVGDAVRVEAGDWMTHYTKSGIYTEDELSNLVVVKVGGKEILCKTAGGREVLIRTAGHLEPLSSEAEPVTDTSEPTTDTSEQAAASA